MNCTRCAAPLSYVPGQPGFACASCGSVSSLPAAVGFSAQPLTECIAQRAPIPEVLTYPCHNCGARTSFAEGLKERTCPFCDSPLSAESSLSPAVVPRFVLPFLLGKDAVQNRLDQWKSAQAADISAWMRQVHVGFPGSSHFHPVYLPFWVFRNTEVRTLKAARAQHPELAFPGGVQVPHFLNYYNGKSFSAEDLGALEPWNLKKLVPYTPLFVHRIPVENPLHPVAMVAHSFFQGIAFPDAHSDSQRCLERPSEVVSAQEKPFAGLNAFTNAYLGFAKSIISAINPVVGEAVRELRAKPFGPQFPRWHHILKSSDLQAAQCLLPVWICHLHASLGSMRVFINANSGEVVLDRASFKASKDRI